MTRFGLWIFMSKITHDFWLCALYFFFWRLCCLFFFFDLRILITFLVSSYSSCLSVAMYLSSHLTLWYIPEYCWHIAKYGCSVCRGCWQTLYSILYNNNTLKTNIISCINLRFIFQASIHNKNKAMLKKPATVKWNRRSGKFMPHW